MTDNPFGTQSFRKLMIAEAFITFTVYIILKAIYNWRNKEVNSEGIAKQSASAEHQQPSEAPKKQLSIFDFDIAFVDKQFRIFFLNHMICMGFALLFSAHAFELIVCFVHMIGFFLLLIFKMKEKEFYYNIVFCNCQGLNLSLILTGLIGMDP